MATDAQRPKNRRFRGGARPGGRKHLPRQQGGLPVEAPCGAALHALVAPVGNRSCQPPAYASIQRSSLVPRRAHARRPNAPRSLEQHRRPAARQRKKARPLPFGKTVTSQAGSTASGSLHLLQDQLEDAFEHGEFRRRARRALAVDDESVTRRFVVATCPGRRRGRQPAPSVSPVRTNRRSEAGPAHRLARLVKALHLVGHCGSARGPIERLV